MSTQSHIGLRSRVQGCLLGGAVGDALGAPVEFLSHEQIIARFGQQGIRDFVPCYGRLGAITDDTQMTLFTAEGLIRADIRLTNQSRGDLVDTARRVVHHAYLRWLKTQGVTPARFEDEIGMDGWLIGVDALWAQRAPGSTCLSALRDAEVLGALARNDSKGCGTVMRTAPIGIVARDDLLFRLAIEISALTHGHLNASLSAGFLSRLIAGLMKGADLAEAIDAAKRELLHHAGHLEVLRAVEGAEKLASERNAAAIVDGRLGEGWIAEEAVAIALHAVLVAGDLEEAVILAVNHSGDSDSTGAIAGNIAGALYGRAAIPDRWLSTLELRDEIIDIATDLAGIRDGSLSQTAESVWASYPGW